MKTCSVKGQKNRRSLCAKKKNILLCCPPSGTSASISYTPKQWDSLIYAVRQIFTSCYISFDRASISPRVFDCGNGSALFSAHRIHDIYTDCFNGRDEAAELNSCSLELSNRFRCTSTTHRCIPRVSLKNGVFNCHNDTSDENVLYTCVLQNDYGCKEKRGSLQSNIRFSFWKICDSFIDFTEGNRSDETNCPPNWTYECNSSRTRCDGHWHCRDGRDELHCERETGLELQWVTLSRCHEKNQFYCLNRTTQTLECYSHELAGDGIEDCVGGIDERVGGFCQKM